MNTPRQNADIEWENLHICDQLETVRTYLTGSPSMQRIVDDARLYIAHLRGRVDSIVPVIEAPIGLDGQVQEEWLVECVRDRFLSMRRQAMDARMEADRTETAINVFAASMERAAQSRPTNAPF